MKFSNSAFKKKPGFTLLETLIAFSILSILLTVIIQTQTDTVFFLRKTDKLALAQKEVINALLKIERNYNDQSLVSGEGYLEEDHVLAGTRWKREAKEDMILNLIPVMKITYRLTWSLGDPEDERYFESSILGELK